MRRSLEKMNKNVLFLFFVGSALLLRYVDKNSFVWKEVDVTFGEKVISFSIVGIILLLTKVISERKKERYDRDITDSVMKLIFMFCIMNTSYLLFCTTYHPVLYVISKSCEYVLCMDVLLGEGYKIVKSYVTDTYHQNFILLVNVMLILMLGKGAII